MSQIDSIIRRTTLVDTSGAYRPPAIQATVQQALGGGVYFDQDNDSTGGAEAVLSGRISLSIIAALVGGAVLFYLWTHEIQGGG